jgi:hypothetical protein
MPWKDKMISTFFGPDWIWIDIYFAGIIEFMLIIGILYSASYLFSWISDFNGAMRVYRQMKESSKGGVK